MSNKQQNERFKAVRAWVVQRGFPQDLDADDAAQLILDFLGEGPAWNNPESAIPLGESLGAELRARIGPNGSPQQAEIALRDIFLERVNRGQLSIANICSMAAIGTVYPSPGLNFGDRGRT